MSAGLLEDRRIQETNERAGHRLCRRCEGTGNELYAMKRKCQECGGSGIAERFGMYPALVRWLLRRHERRSQLRAFRRPRDRRVEARFWLSYLLGIGHWFNDRHDRCRHCGATPSDIDFEMRRVAPFRAECADHEMCRDAIREQAAVGEAA